MDTLPVLCLLGILCSLALAVDKTVPPEDLDGSGDDEDFSGSGSDGFFVDVSVDSTSISTLVPTVEGSTAAQEPEMVAKGQTEVEVTTKSAETTKTPNDLIEDMFAVDTVAKEEATQEATIAPVQQTTGDDLMEENDTKKHHHHHHHHTTTSSTSPPEADEDTTAVPPKVHVDPDFLAETTPSTPDGESELHHVPQEVTTPVEDLAKHGVLHEETTSGSTSAYVDNEEIAVEPVDADHLPALDSLLTTTVAADSHTETSHHPHHHPHHHHHHHHPYHHTTTSSSGGDVPEEVTTKQSFLIEQEGNVQEVEPTTSVAEVGHPHHGHRHHIHHHETTTSTTVAAESEEPHEVHTEDPKGRRVHAPEVGGTTAIPVINEDEHLPDDAENDYLSAFSNVTMNPFDENDEILDSKEEGPSGVADEDMFFEATVPVINKGRMNVPTNEEKATKDDGTSDASHGIMERKELLAGIIAGGVAGLVFAAALVAFVLYRMKKKDEGSYSLEEPKQSNGGYQKPREQREFYA